MPRTPAQAEHQLTTAAHLEFQAIVPELKQVRKLFFYCAGEWGFSTMTHTPRHPDKLREETDLHVTSEQADADTSTPQPSTGPGSF